MNVSMMDSFNLAWKLAYSVNGLSPVSHKNTSSPDTILDTYETERRTIAQQLIEFDRSFSSMFSGKIGTAGAAGSKLTHDQFLEVFRTGNGFTSGCGIEYPESTLVDKSMDYNVIRGTDYLAGVLRPGRRLLNVKLKRHADGCHVDLHDGSLFFTMPNCRGITRSNGLTCIFFLQQKYQPPVHFGFYALHRVTYLIRTECQVRL